MMLPEFGLGPVGGDFMGEESTPHGAEGCPDGRADRASGKPTHHGAEEGPSASAEREGTRLLDPLVEAPVVGPMLLVLVPGFSSFVIHFRSLLVSNREGPAAPEEVGRPGS